MNCLAVQIVRFVEEHQPSIVACEFADADGRRHTLIDKVLIFSNEWLDEGSNYPQPGTVQCEVLARWHGTGGQELARIRIDRLVSLESTEGVTEFVVLSKQIS